MFIYSICIYENDDSYDFGSIVSSFLLLVDQNIKSSSTYFSYLKIKGLADSVKGNMSMIAHI